MAEHANSTPMRTVDLKTPRKKLDDAVYEIGVIADIIAKLATLMVSSSESVCGTSFDFLAKQLNERHEAIQELTRTGTCWAGA